MAALLRFLPVPWWRLAFPLGGPVLAFRHHTLSLST